MKKSVDNSKIKIGVVGLGPVGMILAVKLKDAGCDVAICDKDEFKLKKIREEGIVLENVFDSTTIFDKVYDSIIYKEYIESIPWEKCKAEETNPIWKNYKIETFPSYVLIDSFGYVVGAPALGPMPDGQYQTIDKTFFFIQKLNKEIKQN